MMTARSDTPASKTLTGIGMKGMPTESETPGPASNSKTSTDAKDLAKDFSDSTSMHGLARAAGSRSWLKRLVWSLLLITAAGMAVSNLVIVFQDFLSYQVSTELSEEYHPEIAFPAVTVCNLNRVRKSLVPVELRRLLDELTYFGVDVPSQREHIDLFLRENSELIQMQLGHDLGQMLIECSFDAHPCNAANFTVTFNMELGNCFTFNAGNPGQTLRYSKVVGPANGLVIELFIHQGEYLSETPSAGAKILVHPPGTIGFPEESGLQLATGFSTAIGMKKVQIERTPPPYGQCVDADEAFNNPEMNMFGSGSYETTYTDVGCKKSCYQVEVLKECNCCDPGYPCSDKSLRRYVELGDGQEFIPWCNTSDINSGDSKCLLLIQDEYLQGNLPCVANCKPACSETRFKETLSANKWPSYAFRENMMNKLRRVAIENNITIIFPIDTREQDMYLESNFLRVEVFYKEINYEQIKSTPAYDWNRLLSDVGGQLGLWMGFSLMTGIEIIELLIDFIGLCLKKTSCKKRQISQDHSKMAQLTLVDADS